MYHACLRFSLEFKKNILRKSLFCKDYVIFNLFLLVYANTNASS